MAITITFTDTEQDVTLAALQYYLDTLTPCDVHEHGKHGDETECDGWGPNDVAALNDVYDKLQKGA